MDRKRGSARSRSPRVSAAERSDSEVSIDITLQLRFLVTGETYSFTARRDWTEVDLRLKVWAMCQTCLQTRLRQFSGPLPLAPHLEIYHDNQQLAISGTLDEAGIMDGTVFGVILQNAQLLVVTCQWGNDLAHPCLWDANTGQLKHILEHPSATEAWVAPGQQTVATFIRRWTGQPSSVSFWSARNGSRELSIEGFFRGFSPDGCLAVVSRSIRSESTVAPPRPEISGSSIVDMWELRSRRAIKTFTRSVSSTGSEWEELMTSCQFSADGTMFAASFLDGSAVIWEISTGQQCVDLPSTPNSDLLSEVTFSPDGSMLATVSVKKNETKHYRPSLIVKLWDTQTGGSLQTLSVGSIEEFFRDRTRLLSFSPDGRFLVAVMYSGMAVVWQLSDGTRIRFLCMLDPSIGIGGLERISNVSWAPDGSHVLTQGYERAALWETKTWRRVWRAGPPEEEEDGVDDDIDDDDRDEAERLREDIALNLGLERFKLRAACVEGIPRQRRSQFEITYFGQNEQGVPAVTLVREDGIARQFSLKTGECFTTARVFGAQATIASAHMALAIQ